MKGFYFLAVVLMGCSVMAQTPQQIVINMDRQEFQPLQQVNWRVMAGSSSISSSDNGSSSSGNGLGIGLERMLTERWSLGAHYANIRSVTSGTYPYLLDNDGRPQAYEYRENINVFDIYGRYSFINYSVNKWNLIQVSLLGGAMTMNRTDNPTQVIYGAAASYNYDNLLGFELSTKVNTYAEASTSASLIGYF